MYICPAHTAILRNRPLWQTLDLNQPTKSTYMLRCLFASLCLAILPASALPYQGSGAVTLLHQTFISVDDGKRTRFEQFQIQIQDRTGIEYAEVSIFQPTLSKVRNIEAYLVNTAGKTIRKLKKSEIKTRSAVSNISFYEDHLVYEFSLRHDEFPYTLKYSYETVAEEFLSIANWIPFIATDVPTLQGKLTVSLPTDYPVRIDTQGVKSYQVERIDNRVVHTWEAPYVKQYFRETLAPDWSTAVPHIEVIPQNFIYDQPGSLASWESFGQWHHSLLADLGTLPVVEQNRLKALVADLDDPVEKIRTLYHYLQDETRYINVTIDNGGLKPYPASYVAQNKYGDCKALANYMKAALDLIEVPAYYSTIYAGSPIPAVNHSLPSQQFNHVILCVPLAEDTLWLDCTSKDPFDYQGTFIQNREALVVTPDGSRLQKVPALTPAQVQETRVVEIQPGERNRVRGAFRHRYRGDNFETVSNIARNLTGARLQRTLEYYFTPDGWNSTDAISVVRGPRNATEIGLHFSAETPKGFQAYGAERIIEMLPFGLPALEAPEDRTQPIQLDFPIYQVDSITYFLPPNTRAESWPESQSIEAPFGTYTIEANATDGAVKVVKSLLIKAGSYSLATYPAFYTFLQSIQISEQNAYIVATTKT